MTETRKRPDWTLWLNLPKLKVWQAVALSLDIDPDSMKPSPHGWMSGPDGALSFMPASFADDAQATEFDKRRRIAAAQLAGRENADRAEGALRPFLDLAAGLGWPIPAALRLPMAEVSEPLLALLRPGPTAAEPVQGVVAAAPVVQAVVAASATHRVLRRDNPLAAALTQAKGNALDARSWPSVWAALVALAEQPSRPAPLLGYVEGEGVQYRVDDSEEPAAYLTRDAFRKRFKRAG